MDVTKSDPKSSQFPDPPAAFSNAKEEVGKESNVKAITYITDMVDIVCFDEYF